MKEIIAANLIRYRKSLGLSQEQLAATTGVTRQSINNYENAKTLPDSKILSALANALGVTLDDLLRSQGEGLPNFRFRAHVEFGKNAQFAAQVLRMLQTYIALEQAVGLPSYTPESTPCYQVEGNEKHIQKIAALFRHRLGLGDAPITNLFQSVEEIGLKVLRSSVPIKGFFGLSACSDIDGAFVLVNTSNISIERQLFTLAHEIGHLIFHRGEYQEILIEEETLSEEKPQEKVADYFASHLLVPQAEFERMYSLTQDIVKLKRHFRVSYLVILSRLASMGIIDFDKEKAKICAIYKKQHDGASLQNLMELPPVLLLDDYPENERYEFLIWQSLKLGKISEMKAAELLNLTVEKLRVCRQEIPPFRN
ncbi:XRE family transcriptional regulator [Aetokthonos hydrillicola Thurmond2011]|jgi:Zn-dependent peptidase ImmA (M78 family)/transcriptional regulator with XRE-family HTH domain|uniref:XRE family transcriptional regulator n=2 Tax=Aetokthonos TaxID=1550243 RepID=A0AAP5MAD8_9CYAN|nr:XRE family transcriptional regulator [Aetokthonos hydrillicola]MBO3459467.1 helix-turn-helix domain-containing protein [Aetokthonos hydrillicola CCALA 1050]MBW4583830.1 XRE family transcriptional regulator [Aetokthonos hydrillicola CCALA 1050]MDR9895474.1 XRE family transcriptional regulator [Aetokthonos hydrillicola Thurmond2011]